MLCPWRTPGLRVHVTWLNSSSWPLALPSGSSHRHFSHQTQHQTTLFQHSTSQPTKPREGIFQHCSMSAGITLYIYPAVTIIIAILVNHYCFPGCCICYTCCLALMVATIAQRRVKRRESTRQFNERRRVKRRELTRQFNERRRGKAIIKFDKMTTHFRISKLLCLL